MNWTEGPATWKQLRFLSEHGYTPEHPLTKNEAADLIRDYGGQPETLTISTAVGIPGESTAGAPHDFHTAVEVARRTLGGAGIDPGGVCKRALDSAIARRQEFWMDTCRNVQEMRVGSRQAIDLCHKHGCLLYPPGPPQVQAVLDALDPAMPSWDRDRPELFYETLTLNFPELLRHR